MTKLRPSLYMKGLGGKGFTFRIKELSEHLKKNRKDFSCQRALLKMVGKRRKLLNYLAKTDITKYRELIEKLGLRK